MLAGEQPPGAHAHDCLMCTPRSAPTLAGVHDHPPGGRLERHVAKQSIVRISVKEATCFGFKVATHRSAATLVVLGWVSGFFESSFE